MLALVTTGLALPAGNRRAPVVDHVTSVAHGVARAGFTTTVGGAFELVGFEWQGVQAAEFELRAQHGGRWTRWTAVDGSPSEGPDGGSREHHDRTTAGPVWVGTDVKRVQVRVATGALRDLKIHALHTAPNTSRSWVGTPAGADPARPDIVSRAGWGADESWKTCAPEYAPAVRFAVLHHTVTANDYKPEDVPRILQGIYQFHTKVNRWCDVGYNAFIDRFGRAWEGRFGGLDRPVIGAHAGGFNSGSVGVAMLGDFTSTAVSDATRYGLRVFLDWKLALHLIDPRSRPVVTPVAFDGSNFPADLPVAIDAISTHRDLDATACPGDFGARIVELLRQEVQADILNNVPEPLAGWRPVAGGPALLVLDQLGGLYPAGSQPSVRHTAFWPRWPIARAAVRDGNGGYVLDGYGGVHPFGAAPPVNVTGYWSGWDIARGIARGAATASGWVLDGYGGLHPYGAAPPIANGPYWGGWDIARGVATNGARTGGYVLDGWGGVHPFGTAARVAYTGYWPGWDIARAIAVRPDGLSGWVLDGYGGLHPFGGAPSMTNGPYWGGWDIARGLVLTAEGNGGWVVDGWGGLHAFGDAPDVAASTTWAHLDVGATVL